MLDRRILARLDSLDDGAEVARRVARTPLRRGKGALDMNLVTVVGGPTESTQVEKCIDVTDSELTFWRHYGSAAVLSSQLYNSVRPIDIVVHGPVAILYFRYLPALDRETKIKRRAFQKNVRAIAAAIADLNAQNLMHGTDARAVGPFPLVRPTPDQLQHRLDLVPHAAHALHELWTRARGRWEEVREIYHHLPTCLNHNDVSPNNVIYSSGVTTLADWELASIGPIGSDLHTIIRWSGRAAHDPDHVDTLIATYLAQIHRHEPSITEEQIRVAAWGTYFLRYTNLKFASARYLHSFGLALGQMLKLPGIRRAPRD